MHCFGVAHLYILNPIVANISFRKEFIKLNIFNTIITNVAIGNIAIVAKPSISNAAPLLAVLYIVIPKYVTIINKVKNPSFSGIGTGAHYLTIETQEHARKKAIEDASAALKETLNPSYGKIDISTSFLESRKYIGLSITTVFLFLENFLVPASKIPL